MALTQIVADNLFACHTYLAALTGKDILRIEKDEADQLGSAINNVARHYDLPGVSEKTVDWIALARTLGMVYGTRLFAMGVFSRAAKPAPDAKPAPPSEAAPGKVPEAQPLMVKKPAYPGGPVVEVPLQ